MCCMVVMHRLLLMRHVVVSRRVVVTRRVVVIAGRGGNGGVAMGRVETSERQRSLDTRPD